QRMAVGDVIVSAPPEIPACAETEAPETAIGIETRAPARTPWQLVAVVETADRIIARIHQRRGGAHIPACKLAADHAFEPGDARTVNVVRQVERGIEGDHVADVVAVHRHRPMAPIGRAAQADFEIARTLRTQVGIAETRIIQIIEGGRAECGAPTRGDAQVLGNVPAPQHAARGLAAELAIVVAPYVGLQ